MPFFSLSHFFLRDIVVLGKRWHKGAQIGTRVSQIGDKYNWRQFTLKIYKMKPRRPRRRADVRYLHIFLIELADT